MSPPALKMKIKEVKKEKGDRKLIAVQKKKKVLKMGSLRKKDLKKLTLYIKNGANCPCSQLDNLGSNFLIMGRKVDQQLLLMSIHKWEKKSKELKYALKYMKSQQCPTYHTVFQWSMTVQLISAQSKLSNPPLQITAYILFNSCLWETLIANGFQLQQSSFFLYINYSFIPLLEQRIKYHSKEQSKWNAIFCVVTDPMSMR